MPNLRELINDLTVETTSPDNKIKARWVANRDLTIAFRSGAYETYTEESLQEQLSQLARLTFVGYRRGRRKAVNITRGLPQDTKEEPHWDARYRRYFEAMGEIVAYGKSPSGAIRAKSQGMARWKIKIEHGTLNRMSEQQFIAETLAGFKDIQRDSNNKITLLKDEHFGLNIPNHIRRKHMPNTVRE